MGFFRYISHSILILAVLSVMSGCTDGDHRDHGFLGEPATVQEGTDHTSMQNEVSQTSGESDSNLTSQPSAQNETNQSCPLQQNCSCAADTDTNGSSSSPQGVAVLQSTVLKFDENAPSGTLIGKIKITDSGSPEISSFVLSDPEHFEIDKLGTVSTKGTFDFESKAYYHFTVKALNNAGESNTVDVTVDINDIDEIAPKLTIESSVEGDVGLKLVDGKWTAQTLVLTFLFDEGVWGFDTDAIAVTGAAKGIFKGSGSYYTLELTPPLHTKEPITVSVPSGIAVDHENNGNEVATLTKSVDTVKKFVTTWETNQSGATPSDMVRIGTNPSYSYDYTVDWGDGVTESGMSGDATHTYAAEGTYTVTISGDFPSLYFGDAGYDNPKLLSVEQWGTSAWQSMHRSFYNCTNVRYNAPDIPDLTQVHDMSAMFMGASLFNGYINEWNTSNVTDMSSMFKNAFRYNQYNGHWDTSAVTNMSSMYEGAVRFNQYIGDWDTSSVTNFSSMFEGAAAYDFYIGDWDTSSAVTMASMFRNAAKFDQYIGGWNTAKVTDMSSMFEGTLAYDQYIGGWDTASVTTIRAMFRDAVKYDQYMGGWITTNVTDMSCMFEGALAYDQYIGGWDTSGVTTMHAMFKNAVRYDQYNGSWANTVLSDMGSMYEGALSYNSYSENFNTQNVTNMDRMFYNAAAFTVQNLSGWNVAGVTTHTDFDTGSGGGNTLPIGW